MTEDEHIALGEYCENLKSHEHFQTLLQQFELQVVTHFLSTAPTASVEREGIYASLTGVRDFIGHMDAIIDSKNTIIAKNAAPPDEDAPQQDIDY